MVASSFFMTWHMQQELRLKMITGCSDMRRRIRVSADSATSMDKEEALVVGVDVGTRSTCTTSFEQRRRPCIAGASGGGGGVDVNGEGASGGCED